MVESSNPETSPRKRHPWLVGLAVLGIILAAFPWILAKTSLRNRLLSAIVNSDDISVTSTNATFGYVAPLSLSGLKIVSKDEATEIKVNRIEAEHSWLGLLMSRPELGTFRFKSPHINLLVDPAEIEQQAPPAGQPRTESEPAEIELPNLAAEIVDASLIVRTPNASNPPIDLNNIQITLRVENEPDGPVLRIDPTTVFDHQKITPELCGQGLQLIAPMLADEVDAEGEFSLRIDEFRIPVGVEPGEEQNKVEVKGELQLHEASVGLRNTIAKNASDLILQLIGTAAPEKLTVAKDLIVGFEVIEGRIHHEGLALLLPHGDSSIEFVSSGSVGLDESLDLNVAVRLPASMLGGGVLGKRIEASPLVIQITGDINEPNVEVANSGSLIDSIRGLLTEDADANAGDAAGDRPQQGDATSKLDSAADIAETVSGAVGGLLKELREGRESSTEASARDRQPLIQNLRERLRSRESTEPQQEEKPPQPVDL